MRPEIIVPLLMGSAMLWWIGRGITLAAQLVVGILTLALIAAVVWFERGF